MSTDWKRFFRTLQVLTVVGRDLAREETGANSNPPPPPDRDSVLTMTDEEMRPSLDSIRVSSHARKPEIVHPRESFHSQRVSIQNMEAAASLHSLPLGPSQGPPRPKRRDVPATSQTFRQIDREKSSSRPSTPQRSGELKRSNAVRDLRRGYRDEPPQHSRELRRSNAVGDLRRGYYDDPPQRSNTVGYLRRYCILTSEDVPTSRELRHSNAAGDLHHGYRTRTG